MFTARSFVLVLLLSVLLASIGCGEAGPEVAEVQGVVRVRGKTYPQLAVRFMPDPTKGNDQPINAYGITDQDGKFELTYSHKGSEGKGAPVGWHRVTIEDTRRGAIPPDQPLPPQIIPPAYYNLAKTPLSVEVKAGEVNSIDLEVK
jgi:hypothetical protein